MNGYCFRYEQILREQKQRREEVKKNSKAITLENEKPFSFYFRDQNKPKRKNKYEREKFVFKAREVPWYSIFLHLKN